MIDPVLSWSLIFLLLTSPPNEVGLARPITPSTPTQSSGQRVMARDGDTVVIEGGARVLIRRRRPAFVRFVADPERRFVIVLVEHLAAPGDAARRVVHEGYEFGDLRHPWPLERRWEGHVWLEQEEWAGSRGSQGTVPLTLETPDVRIVFGSSVSQLDTSRIGVVHVPFHAMGSSRGGQSSFDQEERRALAAAEQNAARRPGALTGGQSVPRHP